MQLMTQEISRNMVSDNRELKEIFIASKTGNLQFPYNRIEHDISQEMRKCYLIW